MPDFLIKTTIRAEGDPNGAQSERIVRAKNEARAIRHVVADTLTVERATGDDYMRVAAAGGKVETAAE